MSKTRHRKKTSSCAEQFLRYKKMLARMVPAPCGEAQPPLENVKFWMVLSKKSGSLTSLHY